MSENSYNEENTIDVDFEITSEVDVQVGTVYQGASIDDNVISTKKTWSSQKISDELALKADSSDLATVATTGSFNDLTDKPVVDTVLSDSSNNAIANSTVKSALNDKANLSQILIERIYGYQGTVYPQVTDIYQIRTLSSNYVVIKEEPNTSSEQVSTIFNGDLIYPTEIVTGESYQGVDTWAHVIAPREGYVSMYYVAPFYECEFEFEKENVSPTALWVTIKPYQMGAGAASPTNERPLREWGDSILIRANDVNYEIELPEILYGGRAELMSESGLLINDYSLTHLDEMYSSWTRVVEGDYTSPVIAYPDYGDDDAEAPSSTDKIGDIFSAKFKPDSEDNILAKTTDNTITIYHDGHILLYSSLLNGLTTSAQIRNALDRQTAIYRTKIPMTSTFSSGTLYNRLKTIEGDNSVKANCGPITNITIIDYKTPSEIEFNDKSISSEGLWSSEKISNELSKIPSSYDADDITYDNTSSGLTATDAQSAIDEIAAEIEVLRGAGFRNTLLNVQSVEYTSSTLNPT